MADFNVNLAQPQASGARPLAPVQHDKLNLPNPWVSFGLGVAESLIKNSEKNRKAEKEAADEAVVGEFVRTQTALSDSVSQGGNLSRASAIARANFSKFSASYPHLVDKFAKANKDLFEYADLADVKSEEQMLRDERKQLRQDALKAGYEIPETAPPALVESTLKAFQATRKADEEFQRIARRNQESRSANAEERAATDYRNKVESIQLLTTIGDTHVDAAFNQVQAFANEMRQGGDPQVVMAKLTQYFSKIDQSLTAVSGMHPELAAPYKALFSDIKKLGTDTLEGKIQGVALENQVKELQNRIMLTTLQSPENKAFYGLSKVFNGQIPANYLSMNTQAQSEVVRLTNAFQMQGNANTPYIIGDKTKEEGAYALVKSQIEAIEGGKVTDPETTKSQISNLANNVLKQVGNASANGISSQSLTTSFNFISSPEYAKLVSYGKIDKDAAASANKVFSLVYERDISKSLEKKMDEVFRTVNGKPETYGTMIDFQWNGSGVAVNNANKYLNLLEMGERDAFITNTKPAVAAMNQLIRAGAHMEGHTDYAKYWEENKHNILPSYFPDPAKLKPGQVVDGYKYIGGNVKAPNNWVKEATESKK